MESILSSISTWVDANTWHLEAAGRIVVAAVLGAIVGAEREHRGRSAGFRTQMLVAMGAALVMVISLRFADVFGPSSEQAVKVDPGRIAYGVMVGIGFLGAGAIIRHGTDIRGLTTAASLWCTAAIGLACGFGMFGVAIFATVLCVFALSVMQKIEPYIYPHLNKSLTLVLPYTQQDNRKRFTDLLWGRKICAEQTDYSVNLQQQTETIVFNIILHKKSQNDVLADLAEVAPDLISFSIE